MSAVPCSSVSVRTLADGTLRISFDVEPMHAQDAFRLFAAPGTPAAIAALQSGYAAVVDQPIQPVMGNPITKKPTIGPLCMLAVQWCKDPMFWRWTDTISAYAVESETGASNLIKSICDIDSRKALDTDPAAAERFHRLMRGPYIEYMLSRGGN